MPGEEEQRRPDGILNLGRCADSSADRDGRADTNADGPRVADGARGTDAPEGRPSTPLVRTTITATAAPPQQFTGRDVTITGRLTADGTPVAAAFVTLYNADDVTELVLVVTATTDDEGFFQFTLTDTVPGHHTYVVRSSGTAAYEPSVSAEMVITFVTIPTTITATAAPLQQSVGRNVAITGTLTADGTPVAEASVTLCNADDVKGVAVATTATDAAVVMDDGHRSHTGRYVALAVLFLVVASLLFPLLDGMSVAGFFGDKTYLVILQDNDEIRATGGLMDVFGLFTVHDGTIASLQYQYVGSDIRSTWNPIVNLSGPASFTEFFGVGSVALSDSNVQYDFASFAPKMQSDFYNATGQRVDGIIALDFTAVEAIMNVTGPITVSGEVITSRNVVDRLHYYSGIATATEGGAGGGKTLLTSILSTLTVDLGRLIRDSSVQQKLTLYSTLQALENEGHVLVYPNQGFWFRSAGGSAVGESTPSGDDFISVVDTTLGTGKADFGVTRTIDDHVELFSDGSAVSTLTLTYTNGCFWDYDVLSTALVPPGAEHITVQNATHAFRGPEVTNGDGFTALSSRMLVSANTTGSVTYTYIQPNVVSASGIGYHYDLYVHKQAGITSYILNASVQLPPGATMIHAENVGLHQVVDGDAHVSVAYT